ncbi:hypothetical protein [Thermococcus celer]|uniref:Uncharacterized protein n=1 Tax=Thermococcus celer Vu 13 = JCM 8558 TaxID=1293037 RepID=A0A218P3R2_THECE|nr:hypothetical protein [Thermococcus celer]ASI99566.1 hypothetical protein A3L02_08350 [Thermococcus celer Vu 13 = JCM 8558]
MGRLYTLFRWEMNDVVKAVLLLFGILLAGLAMKQSLMAVTSNVSMFFGLLDNSALYGPSKAVHVSNSIKLMLSLDDAWMLVGFLILLLGALTFRYDRDNGVARSIYSLPYSNTEIFGVKLLSLVIYGFTMVLLPFAYVALTSYASIAGYLPDITSEFMGNALVLVAFLVLYLIGVATLVSLSSPNAFLAFMMGFAVIYAPRVTDLRNVPPDLFVNAIGKSGTTGFTPFTTQYMGWGLLVPLLLLAASWIIIRRRDVV